MSIPSIASPYVVSDSIPKILFCDGTYSPVVVTAGNLYNVSSFRENGGESFNILALRYVNPFSINADFVSSLNLFSGGMKILGDTFNFSNIFLFDSLRRSDCFCLSNTVNGFESDP